MPKRSNSFQQLILLLHRELIPAGATITESRLDPDPISGEPREVDIKIDYEVAGYPVSIVIECRDKKRPATVQWIDELFGKYPYSAGKVVAVSRSGFSKPAREKAKKLGIETMTMAEATNTEWAAWVNHIDRIWFGFTVYTVENTAIHFVDQGLRPPELEHLAAPDATFETADGGQLGNVLEIFDRRSRRPDFDQKFSRLPRRDDGSVHCVFSVPLGTNVVVPSGNRYPAFGISYTVRPESDLVEVPLKPGQWGAQSIATGLGEGRTWQVQVASVLKDGKASLGINLVRTGPALSAEAIHVFSVGDPIPPPPSAGDKNS